MDKKKLKIAIYDTKGELHDTVEGECDGEGLLATMASIVGDEGIPVVRLENEGVIPDVKDWAPGLSFRIKIGNVEFDVSGQQDESKKMYERILEDLPRLVAMANSDVAEMQNALNEFKSLMSTLK
jgi:hypothetical protein